MVRPCVARRFQRAGGKRCCINVSGLWLEAMLRAIMDISAPVTSLADRPWTGHLGHQVSQAPGRPNLHLVSFSRRPRQGKSLRDLRLARLEGSTAGKNTPGDARKLVSERDCQHVVMQPLLGSFDPRFESVARPPGWLDLDQHDPCHLHEEDAQVSIAALGYLAEDRAIRRSRFVLAPGQAMQRSHAPWRRHRRFRSPQPWRWR